MSTDEPSDQVTSRLDPASPPGRSTLVLVVEDDPRTRRALLRSLQASGVRAIGAECVESAVAALRQPVTAAILDFHLGHGDTCESLLDHLASIPHVVLTGAPDEARRRLGGCTVLPKSTSISLVLAHLGCERGR